MSTDIGDVPLDVDSPSVGDSELARVVAAQKDSCYLERSEPYILQLNSTCGPHFYCPNSTIDNGMFPTYCIPSPNCVGIRLNGEICDAQGIYEPVPCKPRYYCPSQFEMLPCPQGNYCPVGRVQPIPCQPLSSCPEGAQKEVQFMGIVLCILIDILLLVGYRIRRVIDGRKSGNYAFEDLMVTRISKLRRENISFTQKLNPKVLYDKLIRGNFEESTIILHSSEKQNNLDVEKQNTYKSKKNVHEEENGNMQDFSKNQGKMVATFRNGLNGLDIKMNFIFKNLGLTLSGNKTILEGVSGEIRAGRLTAIMGPSGAGKTTFMNVLMGKVPRTHGKLYVNGRIAEMHQFKKIIGYVPQDDTMLRELTVYENVYHAARIKLPATWTNAEVREYVWTILSTLNLSHVAHIPIGDVNTRGISGGQRKRTNIALELAAIPLAIFLDEPTSGLDATSALTVTQTLKSLSRLGLTIVAVIHQPRAEICKEFDDVVMIAPGGKTAYQGPMEDAQLYFQGLGYKFETGANPADILMDILSGMGINEITYTPHDLIEKWIEQEDIQDYDDDVEDINLKKDSVWDKFKNLFTKKQKVDNNLMIDEKSIKKNIFVNTELSSIPGYLEKSNNNLGTYRNYSFTGHQRSNVNLNNKTSDNNKYGKYKFDSDGDDNEAINRDSIIGYYNNDNNNFKKSKDNSNDLIIRKDTERIEAELNRMANINNKVSDSENYSTNKLESFLCYVGEELDRKSTKPSVPSPLSQRKVACYSVQTSSGSENGDLSELKRKKTFSTDNIVKLNDKPNLISSAEILKFSSKINNKSNNKDNKINEYDECTESMIINGYNKNKLISAENDDDTNELFHKNVRSLVQCRGAPWWAQIWYCLVRAFQQQYRTMLGVCLEIFVGSVAGFLMGISVANQHGAIFSGSLIEPYTLLSSTPLNWLVPQLGLLVGLAIALAAAPGGVKVFGEERPVYWRESASGHNKASYYIGKTLSSFPRIIISSLHFTAIYIVLACPPVTLAKQYPLHMMQFFGVYGLSSIVSMIVIHTNANLLAVVFCMFIAVFCGYGPNLNQARAWNLMWVWDLSYNRWSTEAVLGEIASKYEGLYDLPKSVERFGYDLYIYNKAILYMVILSIGQRLISFILMIILYRDKQR